MTADPVELDLGELHDQQDEAFYSLATEILYGGAAGGGKSHLMRVAAILWCLMIPGLQVYLFRRTFPDLWKNHMEGPSSFQALLAPLVKLKRVTINLNDGFIAFPNGSKIFLCHCQHEKNVYNYQGAEIHVLMMDELTHFTSTMYRYLRGRVRMVGLKIPDELQGMFPRILCSANPGGEGHNWVKAAWVDLAPPMAITQMPDEDGGMLRQYIPAKMADNPSLMLNDPKYLSRLEGLGTPALVKAMRDGDWNIVAGGMLDDVYKASVHELVPFDIPSSWIIDRSFDWGSSKPFSVGFWAESDGTEATLANGTKKAWPRGSLFRIGEIYGWNGTPDEGCKKLAVEVADEIKALLTAVPWGPRCVPGPADNSIFDAENGVCIADDMAKRGILWERCDKSPGSRKTGWEAIRKRLKACHTFPMEEPGLFVFNNCRDGFIRTVPTLPRDPNKPDDVNTKSEDHVGDETRYRCQYIRPTCTSTPFYL
ncbi:terminase large subunit domain-containing protein [Mesoterricola silvestris]|uniref:Phage terminase large subunit n=1 Tax=Mesoterricola silvestris TaxID=2927979 RepID=A0AA48GM53_9BACT|nr:terminase family protein [Mesoterricola silvestris]BDU72374.1 phage terminase large subunit [Mesoterricola silvestris]